MDPVGIVLTLNILAFGMSLTAIIFAIKMHLHPPKSEKGDKGEPGIQGYQGIPGPAGKDGKDGKPGMDAANHEHDCHCKKCAHFKEDLLFGDDEL